MLGIGLGVNAPRFAAAAPAPAAVTLDPANKGPNVTLSNGDLTATTTNNNDWSRGRGTPFVNSGLRYFEATCTYTPAAAADGVVEIGFVTSDWDATDVVSGPGAGHDANKAWMYAPTGDTYQGGIASGTAPAWASDETTGYAFNQTTGKGWVRDASGWEGDPVAGTGNSFTFTPGTPLAAGFTMYSINGVAPIAITFNFGGSAFAYAVPTGFTALQS